MIDLLSLLFGNSGGNSDAVKVVLLFFGVCFAFTGVYLLLT